MALKLRRGLEAERLGVTPAEGELLYVTDHVASEVHALWVGDGSTAGGLPVSMSDVISVNNLTGEVSLTTDTIPQGSTNKYFSNNLAQDAAANILVDGTHSGISFTYDTNTNKITATVEASGIVGTGLAGEIGYYAADGSTLSSTGAGLKWNIAARSLTVDLGSVRVTSGVGGRSLISLDSYYTSGTPNSLAFRRARGSSATPTTVVTDDVLQSIVFQGFDGTGFVVGSSILSRVSGTVSTGVMPSSIYLATTGTDGVTDPRVRITDTGRTIFGPFDTTDTGSGRIDVRQTVSQTEGAAVAIRNTFNDNLPAQISLTKYRGTTASPLTVQQTDHIGEIRGFGHDGTSAVAAGFIRFYVSGAVSTGKVPGGISLGVANSNGVLTVTTRIDNTSKMSHLGAIEATGSVTATQFLSTGTGTPTLTSTTNLDLSAASAVRVIGGATFRLPQLTTAQRDDVARVPANGDMIYNTTDNKVQAYQNGSWINLDGTP